MDGEASYSRNVKTWQFGPKGPQERYSVHGKGFEKSHLLIRYCDFYPETPSSRKLKSVDDWWCGGVVVVVPGLRSLVMPSLLFGGGRPGRTQPLLASIARLSEWLHGWTDALLSGLAASPAIPCGCEVKLGCEWRRPGGPWWIAGETEQPPGAVQWHRLANGCTVAAATKRAAVRPCASLIPADACVAVWSDRPTVAADVDDEATAAYVGSQLQRLSRGAGLRGRADGPDQVPRGKPVSEPERTGTGPLGKLLRIASGSGKHRHACREQAAVRCLGAAKTVAVSSQAHGRLRAGPLTCACIAAAPIVSTDGHDRTRGRRETRHLRSRRKQLRRSGRRINIVLR